LPERPAAIRSAEPAHRAFKIAIACHSHPSLSKGGAEIAAYALFKGLCEIGIDAVFICACAHADRQRLAFSTDREFAVYHDAERYEHFYHLAPFAVEQQFLRILAEQAVEVVNFHHFLHFGINTLRAVRRLPGMRCFFSIHEFLAICHNHGQMVTRPAQLLCGEASTEACHACYPEFLRTQFALRKSGLLEVLESFDGYVAPSHFLAQRFVEWGLPAGRISVIENGLAGVPSQARPEKTDERWTFGYFGQINPFKGVDVILEAAELLSADAKFAASMQIRIHGNMVEPSESFLKRFDRALKKLPFFSYAGPYNGASVYRLMGDCDYIVVPSRWWENSPVVIQEAYAVGAPVLCSGIGGMAEKVPHGVSGLHFKLGDAQDLVRALRSAADPVMLSRLRAGIPRVASAADMAQSFLPVLGARGKAPVAHCRG
jgi:glycosyltransferase involved in cell wall biosynthesis